VASRPKPKRKYASGGLVEMPEAPRFVEAPKTTASFGSGFASGAKVGVDLAKAYKDADASKKKDEPIKKDDKFDERGRALGLYARGGMIKHTAGPRVGKDDGLIAAQKGEYVVRKAAVNKLGTKALNQINKGRIPPRKGAR
jgi:hypothetical protein